MSKRSVHGPNVPGALAAQKRRYTIPKVTRTLPPTAFLRAPDPAVLVLRGDDAGEFLNGQVSNEVAALADGESRYALLLTPKGKLRAELTVARDGDELLVVSSQQHLPAIQQTIETFRIGYFFSTEDATGRYALVRLIGRLPEGAAPHAAVPVVELVSPLGTDLLVEQEDLSTLISALSNEGLSEGDEDILETARVAAGIPSFGREIDEDTFPAEAGLEQRAVSFEKGCYVGQETVARMHYKGKPNRRLRQLRSERPLVTGSPVEASDGRLLGSVGTACVDVDGSPLALALLRREGEPGDKVNAGGTAATIVEIVAEPEN